MITINNCLEEWKGPLILKIFLPSIIITFAIVCVSIPFLLQNLRGPSKGYFLLQQLTVLFFLLFLFLPAVKLHNILDDENFRSKRAILMLMPLWHFFSSFFYYQHSMFILLQSFTYKTMICDSVNFNEYNDTKNVLVRVASSIALSTFLSMAHLLHLGLLFSGNYAAEALSFYTCIVDTTTMAVVKVVSMAYLMVVSCTIRNALRQSDEIRNQNQNTAFPPLFIVVCIIPIINNLLYIIADGLRAATDVLNSHWWKQASSDFTCNGHFVHIILPFTASVYTIGSIFQSCSYLYFFPRLRKELCCKGP